MMIALISIMAIAQATITDFGPALDQAARTYDAARVDSLLSDLDTVAPAARDAAWQLFRTRALLLASELGRIAFEEQAESASKARRDLGKVIDEHAESGLAAAALLPESAEKYQLRADLLGTMIRSNYRAGKLKGEMKSAIDDALRLDPGNAKALVSRAKMLIFNPSASRDDLDSAREVLQEALRNDPALEPAVLLQAHVWERLGEHQKAVERWEKCLAQNPTCEPARRALDAFTKTEEPK